MPESKNNFTCALDISKEDANFVTAVTVTVVTKTKGVLRLVVCYIGLEDPNVKERVINIFFANLRIV